MQLFTGMILIMNKEQLSEEQINQILELLDGTIENEVWNNDNENNRCESKRCFPLYSAG